MDDRYGVTDGSLTDRFVHYANEVLRELGQTHPRSRWACSRTCSTRAARFRAAASRLRHVDHPHALGVLPRRTRWTIRHAREPRGSSNTCEGWTRVSGHVGVYDYYGHFYVFTPWPIVHSIRRDLPFLHRLGVDRFMSETQQHWANQGINFYVGAKLAWNPSSTWTRCSRTTHRRFYGRAAAPMQRYWERWERP